MRSLFLKIFLYFLLIILLVTAASVTLTYWREQDFPLLSHKNFAQHAIVEYGRNAIDIYEAGGTMQLKRFIKQLQLRSGIRFMLFDDDAHPLTDQQINRRLQKMALRSLRSSGVVFPRNGTRNSIAGVVTSKGGTAYIVAIKLPVRHSNRHPLREITHGFLGRDLLILLLVAAAGCFFLAKSLTAPISILRTATKSFAAGNLATRINNRITGNNELVELAHDFDHMAGKIEASIAAQQRLLRDISHELRSPLTRMGIAVELAKQENNGTQTKALQRIELEAQRMNAMIGQILSMTRMETDNQELQYQRFDISTLLAEIVSDANYEAQSRHRQVVLLAPPAITYYGNEGILAQAFENVIRNAVHYTADNTAVTVILTTAQDQLNIEITDNGAGIPEKMLDKIFAPFFRVADARDRQSGGTGIGLAIAKSAILHHRGTIMARNNSNGGLIVQIVLPLQSATEEFSVG